MSRRSAVEKFVTAEHRTLMGMAALALGLLLTELDQSVFAVALPTMVGDLGGLSLQLWVGTGYVLAGAVAMPTMGRLGDLCGRRDVLVAALGLFVAGSVMGGLAPTMSGVVAARIVQGLGGGGLFVLIESMIGDLVAPNRRPLVLSAFGAVFALAAVVGPVLGGALTSTVGWRWAFWLNVPFGAVAVVAAWRWLPPSVQRQDVRLDLGGITCLVVAVVGATFTSVWGGDRMDWTSAPLVAIGAVTVLAVAGFVLAERRARQPILPLGLFRSPDFAVALMVAAALAAAMFGTMTYLPTYLQLVDGLRPGVAGLFMLTLVTGLGGSTVISGVLVNRTGRVDRFPLLGALFVALALIMISRWRVDTGLIFVAVTLILLGTGIGCAWETLVVVVQQSAPKSELGVATAVNGFFREIGVVIGTAAVGAAFTAGLRSRLAGADGWQGSASALTPAAVSRLPAAGRAALARAYNEAFVSAASWLIPVLCAAVVGLLVLRLRRRAAPSTSSANTASWARSAR